MTTEALSYRLRHLPGMKLNYDAIQQLFNTTKVLEDGNNIRSLYIILGPAKATSMIVQALKENTTLTKLDLSGMEIRDERAKYIAEALKDNKTLTTLNFFMNQIGDEGTKYLAEALKDNTTLTTLNLSDNQIGDEGAKYLAEALKANTTLTILNLTGNKIGDEGVKYLAEALKDNTTLTKLDLSGMEIRDEGAKYLAGALKDNTTLIALNLSWNQIGDKGAKYLAEALKDNTTLTALNLSWNQIGDEGAKYLAEALKDNTTLTKLDLISNKIGDEGAKYLAEALKDNTTLTDLNLNRNQIGDEGVKYLAEALKANTTLTTLNLFWNQIGDEGVKYLAEALKDNKTLTALNLSWNKIGDEGAKYMAEALKDNKTLTALPLNNDLGTKYQPTKVVKYIERNRVYVEHIAKFLSENRQVFVENIITRSNQSDLQKSEKMKHPASLSHTAATVLDRLTILTTNTVPKNSEAFLLKHYQVANKELLNEYLIKCVQNSELERHQLTDTESKQVSMLIYGVDEFICSNFFMLTGICTYVKDKEGYSTAIGVFEDHEYGDRSKPIDGVCQVNPNARKIVFSNTYIFNNIYKYLNPHSLHKIIEVSPKIEIILTQGENKYDQNSPDDEMEGHSVEACSSSKESSDVSLVDSLPNVVDSAQADKKPKVEQEDTSISLVDKFYNAGDDAQRDASQDNTFPIQAISDDSTVGTLGNLNNMDIDS